MAQLVVGAAAALAFGPVGLGLVSAGTAFVGGSMAYALLNPTKTQGPRLSDLKVSGTEYGQCIPYCFGHPRLAGQIVYASQKYEIANTQSAGKGGGQEYTSYTYEVDLLYLLADNEMEAVTRIWLNGELIWSIVNDEADPAVSLASLAASIRSEKWQRMTVYTGASDQLPDPDYEAAASNAPAYRGRTTVFIKRLKLGSSGQVPQLTFEVSRKAKISTSVKLLTTFESDFSDSSTYAASPSAVGPNASIVEGCLHSYIPSSTGGDGSVSFYPNTAVAITSTTQPWCAEWIVEWSSLANVTLNNMFWWYDLTTGYVKVYCGFYSTTGLITLSSGSFSDIKPAVIHAGVKTHIALQFRGTENILDIYVGGVLVASPLFSSVISTSGYIRIGSFSAGDGNGDCDMRIYACRVTFQRVYSGSGFTPPDDLSGGVNYAVLNDDLKTVVELLCERAGMPSGSYDTSALAVITKPVRSIAISQVGAPRATLEDLMRSHYFGCYVTDKLYFVPRGGASVATIPFGDLGAYASSPGEPLALHWGNELELPATVSISYANVDGDYNTATEESDRLLTSQGSTSAVTLAMGMTSAEAKGVANTAVADSVASLLTSTISIPSSYSRLVPSDVVTVQDKDGSSYRMRINKRTDADGLLTLEVVGDDAQAYQDVGISSTDYTPSATVAAPSDTVLVALDAPILRDADDAPGYYLAAKGASSPWPGCAAYGSSNGGANYTLLTQILASSVMGVTTTVLGDWAGIGMDTANSVTVNIGAGQLSSATRDALLASDSVNALWFSTGEIVRFQTATLVSAGVYTLSGLLRGQRGTEQFTAAHASGETVVLLTSAGLRRITTQAAEIGQARSLKGVTLNRALSTATAQAFTNSGKAQKPFAPVDARLAVSYTTRDLTITWKRRTRYACRFTGPGGIYVPLDQPSEAYEIDILNSGGSVVRTLVSTSPSVAYTSAQQLADFGVNVLSLHVRIYQISPIVGRGYALDVTIGTGLPASPEVYTPFLANFTSGAMDESTTDHTVQLLGTAAVSGGALVLDGAGYARVDQVYGSSLQPAGQADWTVEVIASQNATSGSGGIMDQRLVTFGDTGSDRTVPFVDIHHSSAYGSSTAYTVVATVTLANTTDSSLAQIYTLASTADAYTAGPDLQHCAVQRRGGTLELHVAGSVVATAAITEPYSGNVYRAGEPMFIGGACVGSTDPTPASGLELNGSISAMRLVFGQAVYPSTTYTPPSGSLSVLP